MVDIEYLDTLYKWKHEAEQELEKFGNEHIPDDSESNFMLKAA